MKVKQSSCNKLCQGNGDVPDSARLITITEKTAKNTVTFELHGQGIGVESTA
jgi:hypothetical protein